MLLIDLNKRKEKIIILFSSFRNLNQAVLFGGTCLFIQTISGLIVVENESGLLLLLTVPNDSEPNTEQTMLDGALLDMPDRHSDNTKRK